MPGPSQTPPHWELGGRHMHGTEAGRQRRIGVACSASSAPPTPAHSASSCTRTPKHTPVHPPVRVLAHRRSESDHGSSEHGSSLTSGHFGDAPATVRTSTSTSPWLLTLKVQQYGVGVGRLVEQHGVTGGGSRSGG